MSEAITLFCKIRSDDLNSFLKRLSMLNPVKLETSGGEQWLSASCEIDHGSKVQFNRNFFTERADPFTKQRARAIIAIERRAIENPQGVSSVVAHLENTNAIIGAIAEPGFDSIPKLSELITFLAAEYDALIFNGSEFLDLGGNVIA